MNLLALAETDDISLDSLFAANADIYIKALENLHEYADIQRSANSTPYSIKSGREFARILNDAGTSEDLPEVVQSSAPDCTIADITDAPESAWAPLAAGHRVPATFANIAAYVSHAGAIDRHLASLLSRAQLITEIDDASEMKRLELATSILRSRGTLSDPTTRVMLVLSLGLSEGVPISAVVPESGELIGLLVEAGILMDDVAAFAEPLMVDWRTREFAISKSESFTTFMTPGLVPVGQLRAFMQSTHVPAAAKAVVVANLAGYIVDASVEAVTAVASYAVQERLPADAAQQALFQSGGVPSNLTVQLASINSAALTTDELRALLRSAGGDYASIADPTGKRPTMPDDASHRSILSRLKIAQVVKDFKPYRDVLRVSMKQS
jgi:hypothetical protein